MTGLLGPRDPAQPLLTLYAGDARVELSGATAGNWVAKSANLLVDGLGAPARVGLLLPLHWQTVVLLLAATATGATVDVVADAGALAGCHAAFVAGPCSQDALDAGVPDVLALSGHPLGAPLPDVPALVLDYAREVPSYGDAYRPAGATGQVLLAGAAFVVPDLGVSGDDRVLTVLDPATADGLAALLGPLAAGAGLVLVTGQVDLGAVASAEKVTATAGVELPGLRRLR